ncbi:hypothetical protein E2C01_097112 [Portunus trituberculatus]|uniref:Uncharacterized protein n=1 Tax=Portunus trituberculatus TaxID=210409 RepID=A0A5B7K8P4_PORTR|nr:hypothetical protein [Portunus trituberculatus]
MGPKKDRSSVGGGARGRGGGRSAVGGGVRQAISSTMTNNYIGSPSGVGTLLGEREGEAGVKKSWWGCELTEEEV